MPKYIKAINFSIRMGFVVVVSQNLLKVNLVNMQIMSEGSEIIGIIVVIVLLRSVDTSHSWVWWVDVMDNNIEGTLHTMSEGLLSMV